MNSEKQSTNLQMTLREVNRVGEVKKNIPKLRFRGYEDAWEQRKFGNIIQIERGGSPRPIEEYITTSSDGLNWVKIGDAPNQGNYITSTSEKIRPEGLSKTREVYPGDLILSNSMSFGKPYIMAIKGCIHDGWLLLRDKNNYFDLIFLCNLLGTPQMLQQYKGLAAGSTVNNLNKELVSSTQVCIPNIEEQKTIGIFFETIDNLITLHQRKYDALKSMKKTLLSKMFPKNGEDVPEIRFKEFTDAWEQRRLEEIFLKIRNAFVGTSTPYYVEKNQGGHFYIESNNVKHGKINHDTEVFINEEFYQNQKDKWLKTGDIVMVQSGHVGHSAVIPEYLNNSAAHALIMFQEYKIETNPYFINFQFQTESVRNKIDSITTGNTIKHILASDMKLFSISNTQKKEADKLGDFFISLDNLITLHQRKLDGLKNMKKTLLQQMFV